MGPFILASNHQSWFDPPLAGSSCPREIYYAAKIELFRMPILGFLVKYYNSIPVRRSGFDRELLERLDQLLTSGASIIIFPEGTRHLDGRLHPPKLGIGMIAYKHPDVPIVPVHIKGSANIRRQLIRHKLRLKFGEPFTIKELQLDGDNRKECYRKIANLVMSRIAQTGQISPPNPA
jgi:1-acyl-sn-glycerol-3-phosphate acyltransferase